MQGKHDDSWREWTHDDHFVGWHHREIYAMRGVADVDDYDGMARGR